MIIREAKIQKFGKLEQKEYHFSPQINVIYGPNESGKSTLMQFLKAMLFGLEKSRVRKTLDSYKKYEPWDTPAYFSGSMIFETGDQQFFLERNFYHKEQRARLVNVRDGEELSLEYGDLDMLLGNVSGRAYETTCCISQEQAPPGTELGVLLEDERSNLAQTGSGEIQLSKALQNLEQRRKNREKQKKELEQQRVSKVRQLEVKQQVLEQDICTLKTQKTVQQTQGDTVREQEAKIRKDAEPLFTKYKEICRREKDAEKLAELEQIERKRKEEETETMVPESRKTFSPLVLIGCAGLLLINIIRGQEVIPQNLPVILNVVCIILIGVGLVFSYAGKRKQKYCVPDTIAREETIGQAEKQLSVIRQKKSELEQELQQLKETQQKIQIETARQAGTGEQILNQIQEKEVAAENLKEQIQELEDQTAEEQKLEQDIQALQLAADTMQRLAAQMSDSLGNVLNREMSEILAQITGNTHRTLEMTDGHGIALREQTQNHVPEAYSQGTMQQAYFSYRMAAGRMLMKEEPLPFLLDETFANYDEERLRQTLRWLAKQENQIFIFTCRENEMEFLKEEEISYTEIRLDA